MGLVQTAWPEGTGAGSVFLRIISCSAVPGSHSFQAIISMAGRWRAARRQIVRKQGSPGMHNGTNPKPHGVLVQERALLEIRRRSTMEAPCKGRAM